MTRLAQTALATAVLCGFLGSSAGADDDDRRPWYRTQSGPVFPGQEPYWMEHDPPNVPGPSGRFGRGRRFDHAPSQRDFAPAWGGTLPVPPPPEPLWPQPGIGLPHEGHGAFGHYQPGDFAQGLVPLYPRVRVKDRAKAPRHGITAVIAVAPDRRGPQHPVFVPVQVPSRPLKDIKVDDRGSKIKLDYDDYEVEIESKNGVVTIEYDD